MHQLTPPAAPSRPRAARRLRRTLAAALALVAMSGALSTLAAPGAAAAPACSDVEVLFARGTGEAPGLGVLGTPFVRSLTTALSDRTVTSWAVDYAAESSQRSAGPGATALTNHLTATAAACPGTRFVLGGYSQGATVVDIALGIRTGTTTGTAIPAAVEPRVAAVVVFGNPLGISGRTIATASPTYAARARDFCATGDPVCGGGSSFAAHLAYRTNGDVTKGVDFAAALVRATAVPTVPGTPTPSPTAPGTPTPVPTTNPTPAPSPTAPAAACVRTSTRAHVDAGRAERRLGVAYAIGSGDRLGRVSSFVRASVQQTGDGWERVLSC
ncbi:cutinase family protein [Cellulomonas sp. 179-A 4D5 NHS]|uniref:cutinase family protein n=1 Tax=Cellulomonas sp. 179-A 4D5 NHS TaxID=3142378 RepID=UPI00399F53E2